jgi:hypothetical protein
MKQLYFAFTLILLTVTASFAQTGKEVHGVVMDSTKVTLPSSTVTVVSDQHDSITTVTNVNGKFVVTGIRGTRVTITVSSIGYQSLKRRYTLSADNAVDVGNIILKTDTHVLNTVTVVGIIPVTLKEDTVQYQAKAYKVRENAPVEDLIKKLPGVDVDVNGNVRTLWAATFKALPKTSQPMWWRISR